jgi:hypothetical protein
MGSSGAPRAHAVAGARADASGPGSDVEVLVAALDGLLEQVEVLGGPDGEVARQAVAALAGVYGEALGRVLRDVPPATCRRMTDDPLVGHLMVLHGLHPDPVERRVADAVAGLQRDLGDGGSIELAGIDGEMVRVRIVDAAGRCHGVSPAVRDAILGVAPELAEVHAVMDAPSEAPRRAGTSTFIPVTALRRTAAR